MAESLDAFRYICYVQSRWRFVALTCAITLALTAACSLTLKREYTATTRILIEPPAGSDPRAALAVSAIYLESLKTYEQLAASDSLFKRAADRFALRELLGAGAIESIKRSVLKVEVLRNTRILEISVTLPDAARAEELARFLAEQTVDLNRTLNQRNASDVVGAIEQEEREAQERLHRAEASGNRQSTAERAAIEAAADRLETRLREARNDTGYRGERLTVIDPGVRPERPSSPNLALNLAAALLLGLLLPLAYLALDLGFQQQHAAVRRGALQTLARTGDE